VVSLRDRPRSLKEYGGTQRVVPRTNRKEALHDIRNADGHLYFIHVVISLVGIFSGFVVMFGLLTSKRLDGWTALFLATTVATSVTGYAFPSDHLLPSQVVGAISLVCWRWRLWRAMAVASLARGARLRDHRRDCTLSQCLRFNRAGVPEGAVIEGAGADAT